MFDGTFQCSLIEIPATFFLKIVEQNVLVNCKGFIPLDVIFIEHDLQASNFNILSLDCCHSLYHTSQFTEVRVWGEMGQT